MKYTSRYTPMMRSKYSWYVSSNRNKKFPYLCNKALFALFPSISTGTIRVTLADNRYEAGEGAVPIKVVRKPHGTIHVYTCYRLWFLFFTNKNIYTISTQDDFIKDNFKFNKSTILWLNAYNIGM